MPVTKRLNWLASAEQRDAGMAFSSVRKTVQPQRVEPGVRGDDLELGQSRRVALLHGAHVAGDLVDGRVHVLSQGADEPTEHCHHLPVAAPGGASFMLPERKPSRSSVT